MHQHSVHVYLYIFAHNMPQNRNMYVNNCLDNLTEGLIAQHVKNSFIFPEFSLKMMGVGVAFSQLPTSN